MLSPDGMHGMFCWNGLSEAQQSRLIEWGNLPFGFRPEGWCRNPAEVEVTTVHDRSPGPRYYCLGCAARFLKLMEEAR